VGDGTVIALTPQVRVLVAVAPADFRCGIDGLARRVRQALADDPFGGAVFVFRNRRGSAVKLLAYDGQGFWLCQKRLSHGRFRHWPTGQPGQVLAPQELAVLLAGGDWAAAGGAPLWRALA
jgi:transposase